MTQALWTHNRVKNLGLEPHLKFLKNADRQATGSLTDTETLVDNIEDKSYWVTINCKKGKLKPIP